MSTEMGPGPDTILECPAYLMGDSEATFLLLPGSVRPLVVRGNPFSYFNSVLLYREVKNTVQNTRECHSQRRALSLHGDSTPLLALQISRHPAKTLVCPAHVSYQPLSLSNSPRCIHSPIDFWERGEATITALPISSRPGRIPQASYP